MPITSSAKKALRASKKKRVFNIRRAETLKDILKQIKKLVAEKKKKEAEALIPAFQKAIDKAEKRGILKAHASSRRKSRLVALIRSIA